MARCTAPSEGHRSANAAANCPACRGSSRYGGYRSYSSGYGSYPSYSPATSSSSGGSSGGSGRVRAKWSKVGSTILYTPTEVRALTPIRETAENRAVLPDLRDVFLCHAWDDRQGDAEDLHDLLEAREVSVWFSEKDVALGTSLLREIDKGLVKSRVGIVLVHRHCSAAFQQPALLTRSFQRSWQPNSSFPSSIIRPMKPSATSAPFWLHAAG